MTEKQNYPRDTNRLSIFLCIFANKKNYSIIKFIIHIILIVTEILFIKQILYKLCTYKYLMEHEIELVFHIRISNIFYSSIIFFNGVGVIATLN